MIMLLVMAMIASTGVIGWSDDELGFGKPEVFMSSLFQTYYQTW